MDGGLGDVFPERGVVRALVLPAHLDFAVPLGTQQDCTATEKLMDRVDARREPRLLF